MWLKSYFNNRKPGVKINNTFSNYTQVISGVPQGSGIGPWLFLIYINDLPDIINNSTINSLFADDTKLSFSFKYNDSSLLLQNTLDDISNWMNIWELELAPKKCVVMRVGNMFPAHVYNLNGYTLPIQSSFKDLGITFSDNMSFNIHINNICNKAYLIINRLFRCFITNNYIYIYLKHIYRMYVLWLDLILLSGILIHCISLIIITLKIFKNIS